MSNKIENGDKVFVCILNEELGAHITKWPARVDTMFGNGNVMVRLDTKSGRRGSSVIIVRQSDVFLRKGMEPLAIEKLAAAFNKPVKTEVTE